MSEKQTTGRLSFCELTQIAEALNRSEADLQERYKRLAEQAKELLSPGEQQQHTPRGTDHER